MLQKIRSFGFTLILETRDLSWLLYKQMIPAIIVVKVIEELGWLPTIAWMLSPLMTLVGLPDELGLVWATAMLTNIYGGMLVYVNMSDSIPVLSGAQVTVLGMLILVAHALPVEGRIANLARVRFAATLFIRIVGALLFGAVIHHVYRFMDWQQQPQPLAWKPEVSDPSLLGWTIGQIQALLLVAVIIITLLALLKLLRYIGVERLIVRALGPVLNMLGIGREASSVTLIGMTLGISYGGGLLVKEAQAGHIDAKDLFLSMALLGLCHSIIEDTLLIMLIGADFHGIFWGRLLLSLLTVALLARLLRYLGPDFLYRYLTLPKTTSHRTGDIEKSG